eukprot:CAMPEP_0170060588 /NCGR_PEP_ID=MMETSP0019_2-20121128/2477_1 /TAXON_ID=98059 /ORGANISM="Dinobryon sp., Strain UTEXLB2267" /LENGTH=233 /DNA_ID=CAMNT_0010266211 /DNA_START=441 /DNA_END=1142 /DNA_ORIENTATION=-
MSFNNHCAECPKRVIACPNDCNHTSPWDEMNRHISMCPLQEISCPFAISWNCSSTCPGRLKRREIDAHLSSAGVLSSCLIGLTASHREEKTKVARLESTVKKLKRKNSELLLRCNAFGKTLQLSGSSEVSINGLYVSTNEMVDGVPVPVFKKTDHLLQQDLWLMFVKDKCKWFVKSDAAYRNKNSKSSIAYANCDPAMDPLHPELSEANWKVVKRNDLGLQFVTEPVRLISLN